MAEDNVPAELQPLFNDALAMLYPLARRLEHDIPHPMSHAAKFALAVLTLQPLTLAQRNMYIASAAMAERTKLATARSAAEMQRAYDLEGKKQEAALEAIRRREATDALLLNLGDLKL